MAKNSKKINKRDLIIGVAVGFLTALILSSLINAFIFKRIIQENRTQAEMIRTLLIEN